uniref:Uncharacterized protein n=1 Tax=Arundo donax TaxID=35708 RepID=A0A0A8YA98_ARUDO
MCICDLVIRTCLSITSIQIPHIQHLLIFYYFSRDMSITLNSFVVLNRGYPRIMLYASGVSEANKQH